MSIRVLVWAARDLGHALNDKPELLLAWIAGAVLGVLAKMAPEPALWTLILLLLVVAPLAGYNYYKSKIKSAITESEQKFCDPSASALDACNRANEIHLVVGSAIEIAEHPELNSHAKIEELSWPPEEVTICDSQLKFDSTQALALVGGMKAYDPPNGTKFALVDSSLVVSDSPLLTLTVACTDFDTVSSVKDHLGLVPDGFASIGTLLPSTNKVPHNLCLHFVVRFSSGEILCVKRKDSVRYYPGAWSISAEEQFSESDLRSAHPCSALFRRAICEEIFPMREGVPLQDRWAKVSDLVASAALWSVFLEEEIYNFSLLGFVQLNCDIEQFRIRHRKLLQTGSGSLDREGFFFSITTEELMGLMVRGRATAKAVFSNTESRQIWLNDLHPTSRYRAFRLLRALNRAPLNPASYYKEVAPSMS